MLGILGSLHQIRNRKRTICMRRIQCTTIHTNSTVVYGFRIGHSTQAQFSELFLYLHKTFQLFLFLTYQSHLASIHSYYTKIYENEISSAMMNNKFPFNSPTSTVCFYPYFYKGDTSTTADLQDFLCFVFLLFYCFIECCPWFLVMGFLRQFGPLLFHRDILIVDTS